MIRAVIIAGLLITTPVHASQESRVNARRDAVERLIVKKRLECPPPKRWIEVDALADDAGRKSKVICK